MVHSVTNHRSSGLLMIRIAMTIALLVSDTDAAISAMPMPATTDAPIVFRTTSSHAVTRTTVPSEGEAPVTTAEYFWRRVQNPDHHRIKNPGNSWTSRSRIGCIQKCVQMSEDCSAVEFDELSRMCTQGSSVEPVTSGVSQNTSVFYTRRQGSNDTDPVGDDHNDPVVECETDGFINVTDAYSDVQSCFFISSIGFKLNYADADEYCRQRDALLYMPNTIPKYNILVLNRKTKSDNVWLGLSQPKGIWEGFYFADGNRMVEGDSTWNSLWYENHPLDNGHGCVISIQVKTKLANRDCTSAFRFACERPF